MVMNDCPAKIEVDNVAFSYGSLPVLNDICMFIASGEVLSIVGPNGAGKSTLLRCINKILLPNKGNILLDYKNLKVLKRMEIAKKMGYIPQKAAQAFPATVFDVVLMGRRPHQNWGNKEEDLEKVMDVLELLEIEDLSLRDINELSGGQQQNVYFARALAQEPEVLLLDEPTSNLDIKYQMEVMDTVKKIVKEKGISAVISIHDLNLAARYSDNIIMMKGGSIFATGAPHAVLTRENISTVYDVDVVIIEESGLPVIVPLSSRRNNNGKSAGEQLSKTDI